MTPIDLMGLVAVAAGRQRGLPADDRKVQYLALRSTQAAGAHFKITGGVKPPLFEAEVKERALGYFLSAGVLNKYEVEAVDATWPDFGVAAFANYLDLNRTNREALFDGWHADVLELVAELNAVKPTYPTPNPKLFEFAHLPPHLQEVSKPFADLVATFSNIPDGVEKAMGLRKLLEAKDCMVRARLEVK